MQPALSIHNNPQNQQRGSLQTQFTYTPRPGMKIGKSNVHQPAESLPPAVPSLTSAAVAELPKAEDEFWSEFCEAGDIGSASKQPLAELERPGDYCLEQEDFFGDDIAPPLDDSYEMSYNAYQPNSEILLNKEHPTADSNRARMDASSRFPFRYYQAESVLEDAVAVDIEERVSEDTSSSYRSFEKQQMPVFPKRRKRMIDEILDVESEKSANASTTTPSSLIPRSSTAASRVNRLCTTEVGGLKYASSSGVQSKQVSLPQKTSFKPPQRTWMSSPASVKTNLPLVADYSTHLKENIPPLQESLPPASTPSTSICVKASFPPVSSYSRQSTGVPPGVVSSLPTWEHFRSPRGELQQKSSGVCRASAVPEQVSKHVLYTPVPAACSFFTAGTVDV